MRASCCCWRRAGPRRRFLAKAVEGPITAMISASVIQLHPNCKVIVDEDAARELKEREYYDWIFQNEPEWQEFQS
jgi:glucosamine-6-phosphate deaminase